MRPFAVVALRIVWMSSSLASLFLLDRAVFGREDVTVFDSVCLSCVVMLCSLVYYFLGKFFDGLCCARRREGRKIMLFARAPDGTYVNFDARPTEVVWGVPRLTLENVWILVYGVGLILFVGGYCLLSQHAVSLGCFGFAVGVLGVDELMCPRVAASRAYVCCRCVILLACLVGLFLVSVEGMGSVLVHFVETLDFYALGFGFCLPFVSQFLIVAVRESRHYTLGSVFEVVEFGLPFAAFLSIFHLCVAYGGQFHTGSVPLFTTPPGLTGLYALSPFVLWPLLFGYFSCALESAAIDVLISVTVALYVRAAVDMQGSVLVLYGSACCGLAVLGRVVCEYDLVLPAHVENGGQLPAGQSKQNVVYERDAEEA